MSFVNQVAKPLQWVTQGRGSVEVAAVTAGVVTIHWLSKRLSNKPATKRKEEIELEPLECLGPDQLVTKRWDSDVFQEPKRDLMPLRTVNSFYLHLETSDISITDTESVRTAPTTPFKDSCAASEVSLSIPE